MGRIRRALIAVLATIGAGTVVAGVWIGSHDPSSRPPSPLLEVKLARAVRHLLIPRAARAASDPLQSATYMLASARRHFADHCASCHGNDGRGQTEMGRSLYPKAPDMTAPATQQLSDGELFWIIENGVKLTGMPAWGSGSEAAGQSWALVHFIRHLPELTAEDLQDMKQYNPVSPSEMQEMHDEKDFLEGGTPPAPAPRTQGR